ncbi:polysaccharide deacetylase family protein [Burkholderia territorii]|uniref:polysaccharide deacetylase family protein n=1 Tax=Burkholderia territorii TaxID=1503055 RepID=UPI000A8D5D59|nr:polysaccharide deacetylase family protein [Burkholderia territorii]
MTTLPAWPDGARCAVAITVDFNDIHGIQTREPRIVGREKSLSAWRYGATRGVDRLLDAFDAFGVPASWFVPGIVAETHADAVREIAAAGHELGVSGYRCEDFDVLPLAAQIDACRTGRAALADTIGRDVEGFRSFTGNWADGFADWLVAEGFTWSSSWRGDDLHVRASARRRSRGRCAARRAAAALRARRRAVLRVQPVAAGADRPAAHRGVP